MHQVAFAAACCERMLPNYNAFSRRERWGNPSVPRKALDTVWQILECQSVDAVKIHQLMEELFQVCPDFESDDFAGSSYVGVQESLSAIYKILEVCLDPSVKGLSLSAKYARDTVEFFLDCPESIVLTNTIQSQGDEHPLTVREVAKQSEDLQQLQQTPTLDRELLKWLRTSFDNNGKSNIDIG